jgi:serine/threonine-protein kinase
MATVHLGRLLGPVGFSRTVAIKRLHAQFASDPEFVSMFLDEARLAARIRHPNVVPTLDVVATGGELFLVMEYVPGESIARLARTLRETQQMLPTRILSAIMAGVLHGLHAAHEAKDERGHPLGIVHRDMSPQNVLVGTDGVARVLDFGVAKAAGRMQTTREGQIKGKLAYMPPEQLRGAQVGRQSDIYAAGVMLWELVTGQRLFSGDNEGAIVARILDGNIEAPSKMLVQGLSRHQTINDVHMRSLETLDSTILRALAMDPENRFKTAREMAQEIERKLVPATGSEVADWVEHIASEVLHTRASMVAEIESSTSMSAAEARDSSHVQNVMQAKSTLIGQTSMAAPHASPQSATRFERASVHHPNQQPPNQQPHGQQLNQTMAMGAQSPVPRQMYPSVTEGPPVTQPSSISVASGAHLRPQESDPRGARRTAVAVMAGILLGGCVLASAVVYRNAQSKAKLGVATPTSTNDPSVATGTATAAPALIVPEATDAGLVSAAATAALTPPAESTTTTPAPVPTPKSTATSRPGTRPAGATGVVKPTVATEPKPPAGAANDCTTPVWFDAQGVKHYKPQCLDK